MCVLLRRCVGALLYGRLASVELQTESYDVI
jgi:hypothetical protein